MPSRSFLELRLILAATRTSCALVLALFAVGPVAAQPTREKIAAEQRLLKSREARPVEPSRIERTMLKLSDERFLDRLFNPRHGWFVRVGLPIEGAALAAGPAWRAGDADRSYVFTASSAVSLSREWIGELALQLPDVLRSAADDRLFATVSLSRSGRVENEFWGMGSTSADTGLTVFRIAQTHAAGTLGIRLTPWFNVASTAGWLTPGIRAPSDASPSIFEMYDESTAPGLTDQPMFLTTEFSVDLDYRDSTPSTRTGVRLDQVPLAGAGRGGRYRVTLGSYRDQELDHYSFRQVTVDLQQHVPLLHGHRVLSLRALAVLSDAAEGHVVPFYLSPTFGGISVGRGFPTFRFRDENLLALQAEYRYRVNPLMSAAVFVDAGQVAPDARMWTWSQFKTTFGVGLRLGPAGAAALRLDLAFGGEGPTVILGGGHAF